MIVSPTNMSMCNTNIILGLGFVSLKFLGK
jgi:hypothetical protein